MILRRIISGRSTGYGPLKNGGQSRPINQSKFASNNATSGNLRSIVERRFMRMSQAHDRIRTALLASHAQHPG